MRHQKSGRKLNLSPSHRHALLRGLVTQLIAHGRIRTSLAKAKELRPLAERMISLAKRGSLHARRQAAQTVYGKDALRKLFGEVAQQFQNRPGGYTRIVKTDWRRGDHAPMSLIELVALEESKSQVQKKKRRPKGTPPKRGESTQEAVPSP